MTTKHCNNCNNWLVRSANFCHNCGHTVNMSFEYSTDKIPSKHKKTNKQVKNTDWQNTLSTITLLAMVMAAGSLFASWPSEYIALVPLAYLLYPFAMDVLLDVVGLIPEKTKELPKEITTTLRIEHKSDDNRHWLLYDMPEGVTMDQLNHIGKICLPEPMGKGDSFARRKVVKKGVVSQNNFEIIRDFFLRLNYAFYKDVAAPNRGIILTERCYRLLRKSMDI